jgi:seryl-tRNA synthetase
MPIDIEDLRAFKGGDPEKVRESERRRFNDTARVDKVIALDDKWRECRGQADNLRKEKRLISKQFQEYAKEKKDLTPLREKSNEFTALIAAKEQEMIDSAAQRDVLLKEIGNYVHDSVPRFEHEELEDGTLQNEIESTHGTETRRVFADSKVHKDDKRMDMVETKEDLLQRNAELGGGPNGALLRHHQLLQRLGGYNPEAGVKVAGSRCYFLKGAGVSLNYALQMYAQNFLINQDYTLLQPPYFMRKDVMGGVAQLAEFDEALYHVSGGDETEKGNEREKYLIATSEQPICGFHMNEWMREKELMENPIKYAGVSTCFRKEAGSSGKDMRGIFRVHQFEKIEQFVIAHPDKSWEMHEEMLGQCKVFTQSLGLSYRVVNIVSGDLNNAAAKKYDMEAWFPGYDDFREIVSCSNCLDYQSRSMEIRCGQPAAKADKGKGKESRKVYVHMLNSTLCACTRLICCILENFQTPEGVVIPEVLLPFMPNKIMKTDEKGRKYLPYVEDLVADVEDKSLKKKKQKKKKSKGNGETKQGGN